MDDGEDLERFIEAQDSGDTFRRAVDELPHGAKRSHWMWFVFPQLAGLGRSAMAQRYAVGSLAEARAYLAHPVLGERLRRCAQIVADAEGRDAYEIFGTIDAMKLRSCMTLFHRAAPTETVFTDVLDRFFDGRTDVETDRLLGLH
ncbi:MAG: DUF1810 domain-containing protein [Actinobacteria bacterium]|nr:DUF1810 domain-containing protein [Actinomycetota bacterium]